MNTIQDYMNFNKFTITSRWRIENLITNAEIASRVDYDKDTKLIEISFISKQKNKKDVIIQYYLPILILSNPQISKLLSYKKNYEKKRR